MSILDEFPILKDNLQNFPIKNALYAQSGGVTSLINASACGVIQTARLYPQEITKVFAAQDGILGALDERLFDTSFESDEDIASLMHTPSGAFGSCRYKLIDNSPDYARLLQVFKAHNIHYFFYNGGGDSQDTTYKIAEMCKNHGYPITCIGIPKTIDNDLPFTDNSPGFGSVAKYVAISTLEAGLDVASMAASSTKVFILEVMGRHAGWIAASAGLASQKENEPPHIILLPEAQFDEERFLNKVKDSVTRFKYCVVVASEGIRTAQGDFLSDSKEKDSFGHSQLGGVAPILAKIIKSKLSYKCHWAVADYLQRAARHIASKVDVEQAFQLGSAAVSLALTGFNAVMPIIKRKSDSPYLWSIEHVSLKDVANQEKKMPAHFIREDGMGITNNCITYLRPLIQGEAYPPYKMGLPNYIRLKNILTPQKL